jgi:hypothetical protein
MRKYDGRDNWSPEGLALHIQGVIQGAFILAKAKGSAAVAARVSIICGAILSSWSPAVHAVRPDGALEGKVT